MSTVNSLGDLGSLGLSSSRLQDQNGSSDALGQEDFLKLMITQFKNQDPFKPMKDGEFLGQMAQFGTVSGVQDLQKSFQSLAGSLTSSQALQASGLVGHQVLVPSQTANLGADGVDGAVSLPAATNSAGVVVVDQNGSVVRHLDLGTQPAGLANFHWDGVTDDGTQAPEGTYGIRAAAVVGGQVQAMNTLVAGKVGSVSFGGSGEGITLNLDGIGEIPFSQVRQLM